MTCYRQLAHCVAVMLTVSSGLLAADPDPRQAELTEKIQPLLAKYCLGCHDNQRTEGDLSLAGYADLPKFREGRSTWLKALSKMRAKAMPPADDKEAPRPTEAEYEQLIQWIDGTINTIDCTGDVNPGRVTLRRLNRNEYRNTIRDLVGIDYEPVADFPADDVGYGFDNIGDVLSLSPILLEKYLVAADEILAKAIVVPDLLLSKRWSGEQLDSEAGATSNSGNGARVLASNGSLFTTIAFPKAGKYDFRILAAGDQAGPERVKMALQLDGNPLREFVVKSRADRPNLFSLSVDIPEGPHKVAVAFLNDYYMPDAENPSDRGDRNLIVHHLEVLGPLNEKAADLPESHRRIFLASTDEDQTPREMAEKILRRFANRAFRREVNPKEMQRLLELTRFAHDQGEIFESSIRHALTAVLVSPHFLFRVENDPPKGERVRNLHDMELATRLSYFLWSSMPDEELFRVAFEGNLRKDGQLEKQVARMMADPKSRALIDNFATQWLNLRLLDNLNPDRDRFPAFDADLRTAMRTETQLFFGELLRENRPISDFLVADFSMVNDQLARLYGLPNIDGKEFRRVSLQGSNRRGILTQASILALTSNPTRTSPVKRGKWLMENLLGEPPPPPPPNVPELMDGDQAQLKGSLRERMQQHRENPNCAVCHERMDALGFAFEHFDAIGQWRTKDGPFEIDSTVRLPTGEQLKDWQEMVAYLAEKNRAAFVRCVSEKMLTYALGRGLEYYDQCAVDKILKEIGPQEDRIGALILAVVRSDPFQKRSATR